MKNFEQCYKDLFCNSNNEYKVTVCFIVSGYMEIYHNGSIEIVNDEEKAKQEFLYRNIENALKCVNDLQKKYENTTFSCGEVVSEECKFLVEPINFWNNGRFIELRTNKCNYWRITLDIVSKPKYID